MSEVSNSAFKFLENGKAGRRLAEVRVCVDHMLLAVKLW